MRAPPFLDQVLLPLPTCFARPAGMLWPSLCVCVCFFFSLSLSLSLYDSPCTVRFLWQDAGGDLSKLLPRAFYLTFLPFFRDATGPAARHCSPVREKGWNPPWLALDFLTPASFNRFHCFISLGCSLLFLSLWVPCLPGMTCPTAPDQERGKTLPWHDGPMAFATRITCTEFTLVAQSSARTWQFGDWRALGAQTL